jgi:hypothetical protein
MSRFWRGIIRKMEEFHDTVNWERQLRGKELARRK